MSDTSNRVAGTGDEAVKRHHPVHDHLAASEVGKRTNAGKERGSAASGGGYPVSGPTFILTRQPPDPSDPSVTFLTGDIGDAVATARGVAAGKNLEILGADVAGQCLRRGLVDELLVYVLPVLLGDGIRFSPPGPPQDGSGTGQQHAVRRRHDPPVPRPQVARLATAWPPPWPQPPPTRCRRAPAPMCSRSSATSWRSVGRSARRTLIVRDRRAWASSSRSLDSSRSWTVP
jgi:hypothetical protein